jgi:exopolysaccharide production protein ExoZ
MEKQKLNSIQVLRGIAAMMVLLAHAPMATKPPAGPFADFPWRIGAMGVDVFFIISGFVIAMVTERTRSGSADFLRNRLTRILPMYLVASTFLLTLAPISASKIWNTLFFIPLFDGHAYTNPAHWFGWSVALEMWFYMIFSAVLAFARQTAFTTYITVIVSAVMITFFYEGDWFAPHFLGSPLALEFVLGLLLYRCRHKLGFRVSVCMMLIGALLMWEAGSARPWLAIHDDSLASSKVAMLRVATWGLPSLLVVAGFVGLDLTTKIRWPASLVWMGNISYSFYLMQPFAIIAMRIAHVSVWWVAFLWMFSITTVLAGLANMYIEVPLTRALRDDLRNRRLAKQAAVNSRAA